MSLTAADVAEIMRLVEQSTFDELTLEIDGVKLALKRGAAVNAQGAAAGGQNATTANATTAQAVAPSAARASAPQGTAPGEAATRASANAHANANSNANANEHDVPSPLLGTFYRSPKPGAPPYVEVGSKVEESTIVAIIEVMKLMNTVRAGARGTVTAIFPEDGSLVEYDQPLLRIQKTTA